MRKKDEDEVIAPTALRAAERSVLVLANYRYKATPVLVCFPRVAPKCVFLYSLLLEALSTCSSHSNSTSNISTETLESPPHFTMQWATVAAALAALLLEQAAAQNMLRFACSQLVVERTDPLVNPGMKFTPHLHQMYATRISSRQFTCTNFTQCWRRRIQRHYGPERRPRSAFQVHILLVRPGQVKLLDGSHVLQAQERQLYPRAAGGKWRATGQVDQ